MIAFYSTHGGDLSDIIKVIWLLSLLKLISILKSNVFWWENIIKYIC